MNFVKWEILQIRSIIMVLLSFSVYAQNNDQKPLQLTNVTDFSKLNTFPNTCLERYFEDKNNRLWFSGCQLRNKNTSGLYAFDGYKYKLIEHNHPKINTFLKIYTDYLNHKIYGQSRDTKTTYLFYYDILKNKFKIYDSIPSILDSVDYNAAKGKLNTINVKQHVANDTLFTAIEDGETLTLKTTDSLDQTKTYIRSKIPNFNDPNLSKEKVYYKHWVLLFNRATSQIIIHNLKTGQHKRVPVADVNTTKYVNMFYISGNYLAFKYVTTPNLGEVDYNTIPSFADFFKIDFEDDFELQHYKHIESSNSEKGIHADELGQTLIHYYDDDVLKLFLTDQFNDTYDISYLGDYYKKSLPNVSNLKSDNFFDYVMLLSNNDFKILKFNSYNVKHLFTSRNSRAIEMLDEEHIMILNELTHPGVNLFKIKSLEPAEKPMALCNYSSYNIVKSRGDVWGTFNGKLVKYNIEKGLCNSIDLGHNVDWITIDINGYIIAKDLENNFWQNHPSDKELLALNFPFPLNINPNYFNQFVDKSNKLWITSPKAMYTYDLNSGISRDLTSYVKDLDIISIAEGYRNELLLGTLTHGLIVFDKENFTYKVINQKDGLSHNSIASITKDNQGYYWVGTYNGVSVMDAEFNVLRNLYEEDGLVNNECNRYSAMLLPDSKLVIGAIDGFSVLDPKMIIDDIKHTKDLRIYLSEATFYQKQTGETSTLSQGLEALESIELPPKHRDLKLAVATTNYINPSQNTYSYKISGRDEDWIDLGNSRDLILYDLPSGNYKIDIRGNDGKGNWSKNHVRLNITAGAFFMSKPGFIS